MVSLSLLLFSCSASSDQEFIVHPTEEQQVAARPAESVPGADDLAGWLYSLDRVHQITLVLPESSWWRLWYDPYTKVVADIEIDGIPTSEIAVRTKGRYGSFRNLQGKPGFLVDFNYFKDGQQFYGLEQLNLNNMVQDTSQLHDYLAYQVYELLDVPAPRVGYVWLTVQVMAGDEIIMDEIFGLYANVEAYDDVFLARNFDEPDGRLYDGDYWMADDWSAYQLVDFHKVLQTNFELDEGEDVDLADIDAVTETLEAVAYTPQFDEAINERINLDQFNRFWAVETWVGQPDGYAYGRNNYRVYFDPGDEYRAVFMPWDHDWAFYTQTTIETPYGLLATACKADAHCFASFQEYLWSVSTLVAESGIHTQMDRVEELIDPWIVIDPRREISVRTLGPERTRLRQWLDNRDETLELYFPQ